MSIKKLQQLGQARPKPADLPASKPIKDEIDDLDFEDDDDWGGMVDDEQEMFDPKDKAGHGRAYNYDEDDFSLPESEDLYPANKKKPATNQPPAQQPKMYAGNHPLNFGLQDEDDSDDFGTKVAKKKRLDDDTPPESDKPADDDEDLDDLDFDFNQATKAAKQEQVADKKETEDRKKKEIEEQVKKMREAVEEKARIEEQRAREKAVSRNEIDISGNKGSFIEKAREDSGQPVSEDFKNFFGELKDNQKQKKGDSLDIDLSSAKDKQEENIDDKKSFEEFDLDKKFEGIEDDEP